MPRIVFARLRGGEVHGGVRLCARVGLHVRVGRRRRSASPADRRATRRRPRTRSRRSSACRGSPSAYLFGAPSPAPRARPPRRKFRGDHLELTTCRCGLAADRLADLGVGAGQVLHSHHLVLGLSSPSIRATRVACARPRTACRATRRESRAPRRGRGLRLPRASTFASLCRRDSRAVSEIVGHRRPHAGWRSPPSTPRCRVPTRRRPGGRGRRRPPRPAGGRTRGSRPGRVWCVPRSSTSSPRPSRCLFTFSL